MNALFLKDLTDKTRRGLRGRVELGKSGGGLCYGYKVTRATLDGAATTGNREIVPAEGDVILRIFRDYADGFGELRRRLRRTAEGRRPDQRERAQRTSARERSADRAQSTAPARSKRESV